VSHLIRIKSPKKEFRILSKLREYIRTGFFVFQRKQMEKVEMSCKRKRETESNEKVDVKRIVPRQTELCGEGDSWHKKSIFSHEESVEILKKLDEQIVYLPRERFQFKIFTKTFLLPRDKAFYGDVNSDGSCKCCFFPLV